MVPRLTWTWRFLWQCSLFFVLEWEKSPGQISEKKKTENQNCQFELKLSPKTNSNMQNLMMMFPISAFNHKHPSWVNLVQKSKICQTEAWYKDLFQYAKFKGDVQSIFFTLKYPFWAIFFGKYGPKIKIISLSWKSVHRLIRIWYW